MDWPRRQTADVWLSMVQKLTETNVAGLNFSLAFQHYICKHHKVGKNSARALFTVYCMLFTVHSTLFTASCLQPTTHRLMFTVHCLMSTVHNLLTTPTDLTTVRRHWTLSSALCRLSTAHCPLPASCTDKICVHCVQIYIIFFEQSSC